jgi:hypothetical protein
MGKRGPQSSFTETIGSRIIEGMAADGRTLADILRDPGMPSRHTVAGWFDLHPEFYARYLRARESLADHLVERMIEIAANSTSETAAADRVKLSALQWAASKYKPRSYGDKTEVTSTSNVTLNTSNVDASELDADQRDALRAALAAAATQAAPKPH